MTLREESIMRVGVIGIGHWGPNIVANFARHPRVRVTHICDIDKSAFGRVEGLLANDYQCITNPSLIIDNPDIDAVAIVTPASTHYELAGKALKANKHVLCEKPLALDVKECEKLCESAELLNKKLMVGYTFLFNNGIKKLKELVDSGSLGKLYYITATRTHMGLIREDVCAVWDLAPHDVSIINYLVNVNPERVSAVGGSPLGLEKSDVAFITLSYPGGILGQIHVSWVDSNKERVVRVIGDRARAVFDDLNDLEQVRLFEKGIGVADHVEPDFGKFRFLLRDGDIISPKVEMHEPLSQLVDAFVKMVLDDEESISDGRFALEVTKTVAAIHKSIQAGGAPQEVG